MAHYLTCITKGYLWIDTKSHINWRLFRKFSHSADKFYSQVVDLLVWLFILYGFTNRLSFTEILSPEKLTCPCGQNTLKILTVASLSNRLFHKDVRWYDGKRYFSIIPNFTAIHHYIRKRVGQVKHVFFCLKKRYKKKSTESPVYLVSC